MRIDDDWYRDQRALVFVRTGRDSGVYWEAGHTNDLATWGASDRRTLLASDRIVEEAWEPFSLRAAEAGRARRWSRLHDLRDQYERTRRTAP